MQTIKKAIKERNKFGWASVKTNTLDKVKIYTKIGCGKIFFIFLHPSLKKRRSKIDLWCNWQHV